MAGAAAPPAPASNAFEVPFEKYTLDNGLEVILHRDTSLPRVAVNLWYHVGPANEPPGRSGDGARSPARTLGSITSMSTSTSTKETARMRFSYGGDVGMIRT